MALKVLARDYLHALSSPDERVYKRRSTGHGGYFALVLRLKKVTN